MTRSHSSHFLQELPSEQSLPTIDAPGVGCALQRRLTCRGLRKLSRFIRAIQMPTSIFDLTYDSSLTRPVKFHRILHSTVAAIWGH